MELSGLLEAAARLCAESREAQGLPANVEDMSVLAQVVGLLETVGRRNHDEATGRLFAGMAVANSGNKPTNGARGTKVIGK